jgi:hypothetical protein
MFAACRSKLGSGSSDSVIILKSWWQPSELSLLSAIIFKERQSLGLVFVLRILEVSLFLHLKENYRSLPAGVIGCLRLGLCLGSEIESILSAALKVKRRVLVIMHRHCMFRGNKLYMWQQGWIDSRLRNL